MNPIANPDSKTAIALQTITIDVLGNDSDPDNYRQPIAIHRVIVNGQAYDPYTESPIATPAGGAIGIFTNNTPGDRSDDQLYYTAPDFTGTDSFSYTIKDGESPADLVSTPATVTVAVAAETRTPTNSIAVTLNNNAVTYGSSEIRPYTSQDLNGTYRLFDNNTIDLDGNTWKAIALKNYGYTGGYILSVDTVLSFEFKSSTLGEIQGIAWTNDNTPTSQINPGRVLNLYGSNANYGINSLNYTNTGNWQSFSVNLSDYDSGKIDYLLFVGDDDANNKGDVQIRNLQLNQNSTNQRPTNLSLNSTALDENQPIGTIIGTFSTTDPDAGDVHTYTLQNDASGAFSLSGNQLVANRRFDFEVRSSYAITVKSDDRNGGTIAKNFTIFINDLPDTVNIAPTNLALSPGSVNENVQVNTAIGTFTSTDPNTGDTFTYTLVTGTGSADNANFAIVGNELKILSSPNFESKPSYSIRIRTTDSGGLFYEKAIALAVNDLNEAPTLPGPATVNFAENGTGTAYAATAIDPDAGTTLTYSLSGTDAGLFTIHTGTGVVTFVNSPNFEAPADSGANNVYNFTVAVSDGVLASSQAIALTVTNVVEPSIYSVTTSAASIPEGHTGTVTPLTFTVRRANETGVTSTVNYALSGTVSNGADFNNIGGTGGATGLTGSIAFGVGESVKTVTLNILGDTLNEGNETISLTLSNPSPAGTFSPATATTTILDDDPLSGNIITSKGTIVGTSGNDILSGAANRDTITGGAGADIFVYRSLTDGIDIITDFLPGTDRFDLRTLLASLNYRGANPILEGYVGFRSSGSSTILAIDPDGGANSLLSLAVVSNVTVAQLNNSSNFIFF